MSDHARFDVSTPETGPDAPEGDPLEQTVEPQADAQPETQDAAPAGERPAWLPEKFKSEADMAAAYMALERKLAQGAAPTEGDPPADGEPAPEAAKRSGLDMNELQPFFEEYGKTGRLSDASYQEMEQTWGLPREVVDNYVAGQVAQANQAAQHVFDAVGGQESYEAMVAAIPAAMQAGKVSQAEVETYNRLLEGGDTTAITLAAQGLAARVKPAAPAPTPSAGPDLQPRRPSTTGVAPFANAAQVTAAMSDRRYQTDASYRDEVERRLAISDVFGKRVR